MTETPSPTPSGLSEENRALIMRDLRQSYWEPDDAYAWLSAATEDDLERLLNAARSEPIGASVPEGWVLTPEEPTREMWAASGDALMKFGHRLKRNPDMYSAAVWTAMRAALPPVPPNNGEEN